MSNVATRKVYESGFKYTAGIALCQNLVEDDFDMLSESNPKPRSISA